MRARWRLWLSEFEFDAVQKTGIKHQAENPFLSLPARGEDNTIL